MKKAVLLLSGGLDSATTGALAKEQGFELYALTFRYGQRHAVELESAKQIAEDLGVKEYKVTDIDLRLFGGSALTDNIEVPKSRSKNEIESGIPVTYVPARNTIFLSFALAWAEVLKSYNIFIGVNALDYSGYPDCRPEFIEAFEKTANLATAYAMQENQKIRIHAPLIRLSKAEIIREGLRLGVNYAHTLSCYAPEAGRPCGTCDACILRAKGFSENNMDDPARLTGQCKRATGTA